MINTEEKAELVALAAKEIEATYHAKGIEPSNVVVEPGTDNHFVVAVELKDGTTHVYFCEHGKPVSEFSSQTFTDPRIRRTNMYQYILLHFKALGTIDASASFYRGDSLTEDLYEN